MPELPDVENYRRYLNATSLHRTIEGVKIGSTKILRRISEPHLARALRGRRLERARRHGKHLLAGLDDGAWLTMHFGMTGRLNYFRRLANDSPYDRLRLDFDNGYHLAFVNRRLLGRIGLEKDADAFIESQGLGVDAMDPSLDDKAFAKLMAGRRGHVKSALMDQSLLAGIGNIYSDEILFQAGLHPKTSVQTLEEASLSSLFRAIRRVLTVAIKRGAGSEELVGRLPSSYLLPHREDGAPCPRCCCRIATVKMQNRTAYYCPRCQRESATVAE